MPVDHTSFLSVQAVHSMLSSYVSRRFMSGWWVTKPGLPLPALLTTPACLLALQPLGNRAGPLSLRSPPSCLQRHLAADGRHAVHHLLVQ